MIATRTSPLRALHAATVMLAVTAAGGSARAQTGDLTPPPRRDPIAAEALFTRGKQLIEQGKTSEACEAFHESQRLDPAGGTLLRLALCHEADGKLASAWLEFTEVVRVSQDATGDAGKLAERVRLAREHLAAIDPRLPKLVVNVAQAAKVDGLSVTANGLPRNEGTWGIAIPVDAGDVTIDASAPGHLPFHSVVKAENGTQVQVDVPPLDAAQAPVAATPATPGSEATAPMGSTVRPIAIAVGAAGVVALGIGTYFGVTAISKWNDSNQHCPASVCDAQGAQSAHDAKSAAGLSDVTVGIGIAAVAAGVILYVVGAPKTVQARADGVAVVF
jgi:hypothetical protein